MSWIKLIDTDHDPLMIRRQDVVRVSIANQPIYEYKSGWFGRDSFPSVKEYIPRTKVSTAHKSFLVLESVEEVMELLKEEE